MAIPTFNVLSLCSGYGGLDLGLRYAGVPARTVCYVEREAYAAANLAALMQAGELAEAPIWSDLVTFDGKPWRGLLDVVAAGFPCQPHSVAGKRQGKQDARWLWDDIARIIRECEPGAVIIENVPGLLRSGLRDVLQDLALLGYDAVWTRRDASEAGAPHRRSRIFLLAYARSSDLRQQHRWCQRASGQGSLQSVWAGEAMADPDCGGQQGQRGSRVLDGQWAPHGNDPDGRGCASAGVAGAPGPDDTEGWGTYAGPLPAVRRDADGSTSRVDRLRLLGNGVVPQQAGLALRELLDLIAV